MALVYDWSCNGAKPLGMRIRSRWIGCSDTSRVEGLISSMGDNTVIFSGYITH
jgi:hypothetical protein